MRVKDVQSWCRAAGVACTLLLLALSGCTEEGRDKPSSPTGSPPPSQSSRDAGGVTGPMPVVDAGPPPAPVPSGGSQGEAKVPPLERVPSLKLVPVTSQESFVRIHAQGEGWETGPEDLKSYWHPIAQVEEASLGRFSLGHLSNPAQPRGGEQTWMLLRERGGKLAVYGPLITQVPWTPDYMHKVTSRQMAFKPLANAPGKLLWIQLQDKLTKPLDPEGEQLESNTRLLSYVFLVDGQGGFVPLAFQLPEKVVRDINEETQAESMLVVDFPSADRMAIKAGPEGASPEQQAWIGEHHLER